MLHQLFNGCCIFVELQTQVMPNVSDDVQTNRDTYFLLVLLDCKDNNSHDAALVLCFDINNRLFNS